MIRQSWLAALASAVVAAALSLTPVPASAASDSTGLTAALSITAAPALAADDGTGDVAADIIGGTDATEDYPFAVRITTLYPGLGTARCTGDLVESDDGEVGVGVNAHCVTDFETAEAVPAANVTVWYGSTKLAELQPAPVTRIEVYPTWDWLTGRNRAGDWAVLVLPDTLDLTGIPIGEFANPGRKVRVLGWGKTTQDATEPPPILQQFDTRIINPTKCAASGITVGEICVADHDGAKPCAGDSGGGAIAPTSDGSWVLLGAASRQKSDVCGGPSVYTNVPAYARWTNRALSDRQAHQPRHVAPGAAASFMSSALMN